MAVTPDTLEALKRLRRDSSVMPDADASVFGLSMSQISRRVDSMARAGRSGRRVHWSLRSCGPGYPHDAAGRSAAGGADAEPLEVAADAREVHQGRAGS